MSIFFNTLVLPAATLAAPQAPTTPTANCDIKSDGFLGFPTWYKYLSHTEKDGICEIEATFPEDAGKILAAVFEILLRVAGIIAVGFVIYGGVQYVISQGEPENIKNARTTIINALIGLIITIFATAIVNVIAGSIK